MTDSAETWGPWYCVLDVTPNLGEIVQARGYTAWGVECVIAEGRVIQGPIGLVVEWSVPGVATHWRRRISPSFQSLLRTVRKPAPLRETEEV